MTREEWLQAMAARLRPMFEKIGLELPKRIRYRCAITSFDRVAARTIGQCFKYRKEFDPDIQISPSLTDPVQVAQTLLHELIHAALPWESGHGRRFYHVSRKLGLQGPGAFNVASPKLRQTLQKHASDIGPYPAAEKIAFIEMEEGEARRIMMSAPTFLPWTAPPGRAADTDYPRWYYHLITRERRIVNNAAEEASLGPSWWEFMVRRGQPG